MGRRKWVFEAIGGDDSVQLDQRGAIIPFQSYMGG